MKEHRSLQVRGIDHVLVVSSDLDKTREFYLGLLGMDEMPRPDFSFPGLWFQAGDTQVHVTLAGDDAGACGPGEFTGRYPAQGHHIAFEVEDAAAAAERGLYCRRRRRGRGCLYDRSEGLDGIDLALGDRAMIRRISQPAALVEVVDAPTQTAEERPSV